MTSSTSATTAQPCELDPRPWGEKPQPQAFPHPTPSSCLSSKDHSTHLGWTTLYGDWGMFCFVSFLVISSVQSSSGSTWRSGHNKQDPWFQELTAPQPQGEGKGWWMTPQDRAREKMSGETPSPRAESSGEHRTRWGKIVLQRQGRGIPAGPLTNVRS